jgi:transcriptional regulator GlxA family with amidase domain
MRHLVALRMQHASGLLAETHLTVAAVGQAVGYENEFAFSNGVQAMEPRHAAVHLPPPHA